MNSEIAPSAHQSRFAASLPDALTTWVSSNWMPDDNRHSLRCNPHRILRFLVSKIFLVATRILADDKVADIHCPLVDQVIGDNEHGFAAKSQPLALLRCGYHRKGLPCAYNMGEERISTVKNTGNCVCLMVTELYFRGHPIEANVFAAELAGAYAVELLVIELAKPFAPIWVFPYPFLKFTADLFLLALRNRGFLLVQHVKDAHILEIEGILDNVDAFL